MSLSAEPTSATSSSELPSSNPRRVQRQGWLRLLTFLGLVALAFALVTLASRASPARPRLPFDQRALWQFKRQRPQFVLMGNSMVATRFDERLLRRLLRPHRVSLMGIHGSKSAVWYLRLKNLIIASGYKPRVILFFRGWELTEPRTYSTTVAGHAMIQRLSLDSEPILDQKLAPPLRQPMDRFAWYRERAVPVERLHRLVQPALERVAAFASGLASPEPDPDVRRRELNRLFELGNLRPEAEAPAPSEVSEEAIPVFKDVVQSSFLPDICGLAKEHDIPLTFVRVRTRAAASGESMLPAEQKYNEDVEAYVRGCGAEFYDMHDAAWESIDLYGSGDHIADKFRRHYTGLFVEHMGHLFH